jgi:hypothetical protein
MFERCPEFVGKAPMGHKNQTNHRKLLAGALVHRTNGPL